MRRADKTLGLLMILLSANLLASDARPPPWDTDWNLHLREGGCWLSIRHHSYDPIYDDFWLRFIVPINWRDRPTPESKYPVGTLILFLYTSNAHIPKQDTPTLRIDSATIDGKPFHLYDMPHHDPNDERYRFFELSAEDSMSVFEAFKGRRSGGHLDLSLTLSDGQEVDLRAPSGWFFNTWSKMLAVCMKGDAIH